MKIVLLGLSGSGKSSVAPMLAQRYNLTFIEADDEVKSLNGNKWSFDEDVVTKAFEIANRKVLDMDNVIYAISWLSQESIANFIKSGFQIIEMHADFDELVRRKTIKDYPSKEMIEKFKNTFTGYFETVLSEESKNYFALSLDTTKINQVEVFERIVKYIDSK